MLQVADATERLLKDPQVAEVRDVKLRINTLRRRARVVHLPAFVVDYTFGSRFNQHGERTPERFQAVISGMGELLLCCAVVCCPVLCCAVLCCPAVSYAVLCCAVLCCAVLCCAVLCCAVLCCAVLCDFALLHYCSKQSNE